MIFSVESSDSLFSPCINSEFRQILSLCHCQVLLFKRSFLLILYFPGGTGRRLKLPGGQEDYCPPLGTPLCLAWGREMQAFVILKSPPWVPLASQGGGSGPLSYATDGRIMFFFRIFLQYVPCYIFIPPKNKTLTRTFKLIIIFFKFHFLWKTLYLDKDNQTNIPLPP